MRSRISSVRVGSFFLSVRHPRGSAQLNLDGGDPEKDEAHGASTYGLPHLEFALLRKFHGGSDVLLFGVGLFITVFITLLSFPVHAQLLTGYEDEASHTVSAVEGVRETGFVPSLTQDSAVTVYELPEVSDPAAFDVPPAAEAAPVDFQADNLQHDDQTGIVTATGNVMMVQAGRILRADQVSYNLNIDEVRATGHVVLNEESGDIYYAEDLDLKNGLKDGVVKGLRGYMSDGARFIADTGTRENAVRTVMKDAIYTPCRVCERSEFDQGTPTWQVRASEVVQDEEDHTISYRNARFEVYGVPVLYTPYFSHPDGTIKRKSGLLSPSGGYKSALGTYIENSYYWNIAPDKDATVSLIAMTDDLPLVHGQYRQRWSNAAVEFNGGLTYSDRTDRIGGVSVVTEDEVRGHVLANGQWHMNERWRTGFDVAWASDDQYMNQYDFIDEDVLESQIYTERFAGRDYFTGRFITYQDTRIREEDIDQPEVLPEIIARFMGEPGAVPLVGGRWAVDTSFLGLQRSGNGQDMNRFSTSGQWMRRLVSDYGLLTTAQINGRADIYNTRDRDVAFTGSGQDNSVTDNRFFGNIHVMSSYPLARGFEARSVQIEPLVAVSLAPNIDTNNNIPNEDSQDVQIDSLNLFNANRFPGLDRIEDQSNLTYGLRAGAYEYDGGHTEVFIGQSTRFSKDDNPFPEGSGLDRQESDVVGQVASLYQDYRFDYRFQLGSRNLSAQRHEIDFAADWERFDIGGQYLFAKALEGTDILEGADVDESREQLKLNAGYYLSPAWRLRMGGTQDLGDSPGLRKSYAALDFFGQCVSWSLLGQRNLTNDSSGDSDLEITFRLGLKNMSGFEESGLEVGCR